MADREAPSRYRRRWSPTVMAIRYTVESCRACHDFLGLTHDDKAACDSGIVFAGPLFVDAAQVGDWIVRYDNGQFDRLTEEEFREQYELPDERSRLAKAAEVLLAGARDCGAIQRGMIGRAADFALWADLAAALWGEDDARVKELRG